MSLCGELRGSDAISVLIDVARTRKVERARYGRNWGQKRWGRVMRGCGCCWWLCRRWLLLRYGNVGGRDSGLGEATASV